MQAYHREDYTDLAGQRFRIEYHYDTDAGAPWERDDSCRNLVSGWVNRPKRPGELVIDQLFRWGGQRGDGIYYDFQTAIKRARQENWENWKCHFTPQACGAALVSAVMDHYLRLCDWQANEWSYMGIVVFPLTADGDELRSKSQSLWGIETDGDDAYIQEETEYLLREAGARV